MGCLALRRGLDLEVQGYQGEDEHPQVLDEIVEHPHSFWILRVLHVHQRSDLCRFKRYMRLAHLDLELLLSHYALCWPIRVVFSVVCETYNQLSFSLLQVLLPHFVISDSSTIRRSSWTVKGDRLSSLRMRESER